MRYNYLADFFLNHSFVRLPLILSANAIGFMFAGIKPFLFILVTYLSSVFGIFKLFVNLFSQLFEQSSRSNPSNSSSNNYRILELLKQVFFHHDTNDNLIIFKGLEGRKK